MDFEISYFDIDTNIANKINNETQSLVLVTAVQIAMR